MCRQFFCRHIHRLGPFASHSEHGSPFFNLHSSSSDSWTTFSRWGHLLLPARAILSLALRSLLLPRPSAINPHLLYRYSTPQIETLVLFLLGTESRRTARAIELQQKKTSTKNYVILLLLGCAIGDTPHQQPSARLWGRWRATTGGGRCVLCMCVFVTRRMMSCPLWGSASRASCSVLLNQ